MVHSMLFFNYKDHARVCVCVCVCSVTQLCLILCDPMDCSPPRLLCSLGFFREECWSGLPYPSPGDLSDPGIKLTSPGSPALVGGVFTTELPGKQ